MKKKNISLPKGSEPEKFRMADAVQLIEAGQEKAREALEYSTQSGKAMSEIQSGANEVVNAIGQFTKRL